MVVDYYGPDGIVDINKLSRDAAAAISELTVTSKGTGADRTQSVRVKFHSKLTALEALTKMLGGYEAHNAQKAARSAGDDIPVRDIARRLAFMLRRAESEGKPAPVTIDGDTGAVSTA